MQLPNEHGSANPYSLSKEEMENPYLVIDEIFDFAHLPDAKEILWEWMKTTVTGNFHKSLNAREREAILVLYEKLDRLLEAAYLLHMSGPLKPAALTHKKRKRT